MSTINGTSTADNINGTENNDTIFGNGGNDTIHAAGGNDSIYGGTGQVDPVDSADTISGGEGNDVIYGNGGNDVLGGDSGNDSIYGGRGNDTIWASTGDDFIYGSEESDSISGDSGNDTIYGGWREVDPEDSADTIGGGEGNDLIYGNGSDDLIYGDKGQDTIFGGQGNDIIFGGSDTVDAADQADVINGSEGNDLVYGNAGDDIITNTSGLDTLYGGQGNDNITGGTDRDIIYGNEGNDTLTGGAGDDLFVIKKDANSRDTITDFNVSSSLEKVDVRDFSSVNIFSDLALTQQADGSVLVKLENNQTIVMQNTNVATLAAEDFMSGWSGNKTLNVYNVGQLFDGIQALDGTIPDYVIDKITHYVIKDFDTSNPGNADGYQAFNVIDLTRFELGHVQLTARGNDTIVNLGNGRTLTLEGVTKDQLSATENFIINDADERYAAVKDALLKDWSATDSIQAGSTGGQQSITHENGEVTYTTTASTINFVNETIGTPNTTLSIFKVEKEEGATKVLQGFNPDSPYDIIDLSQLNIGNFKELGIAQVGTNAIVNVGGGQSLILQDVNANQLKASDFNGYKTDIGGIRLFKISEFNENITINGFDTKNSFIDLSSFGNFSSNNIVISEQADSTLITIDFTGVVIGGDGNDPISGDNGQPTLMNIVVGGKRDSGAPTIHEKVITSKQDGEVKLSETLSEWNAPVNDITSILDHFEVLDDFPKVGKLYDRASEIIDLYYNVEHSKYTSSIDKWASAGMKTGAEIITGMGGDLVTYGMMGAIGTYGLGIATGPLGWIATGLTVTAVYYYGDAATEQLTTEMGDLALSGYDKYFSDGTNIITVNEENNSTISLPSNLLGDDLINYLQNGAMTPIPPQMSAVDWASIPTGSQFSHQGEYYHKYAENVAIPIDIDTENAQDFKTIYFDSSADTPNILDNLAATTEDGGYRLVGDTLYQKINGTMQETAFPAYDPEGDNPTNNINYIPPVFTNLADLIQGEITNLVNDLANGFNGLGSSTLSSLLANVILGDSPDEAVIHLADGISTHIAGKLALTIAGIDTEAANLVSSDPALSAAFGASVNNFALNLAINIAGKAVKGDLDMDHIGNEIAFFAVSYGVSAGVSAGLTAGAAALFPEAAALAATYAAEAALLAAEAAYTAAIASGATEAVAASAYFASATAAPVSFGGILSAAAGGSSTALGAVLAVAGPAIVIVAATLIVMQFSDEITDAIEDIGGFLHDPIDAIYGSSWTHFSGSNGTDVLRSDSDKQTMELQDGNDVYFGYSAWNVAFGGEGDDIIYGGNSGRPNELYGETGDDYLQAGSGGGSNDLYGGAGNDYLRGGDDNDNLQGKDRLNDTYGRQRPDLVDGNDTIIGGHGSDIISGDAGNDLIYGGTGVVDPTDSADTISGGSGNDIIYGNGGGDQLAGDAGNDKLYGGAGDDVMTGGDGEDHLYANEGNNTMTGGSGADRFYIDNKAGAIDRVSDFALTQAGEKLIFTSSALVSNFSDMTITQEATDAVIWFGSNQRLSLENVNSSTLTANNFLTMDSQALDGENGSIITGRQWQNTGTVQLTYTFDSRNILYFDSMAENSVTEDMSSSQRAALRAAFDKWSTVSHIQFTEATNGADADIALASGSPNSNDGEIKGATFNFIALDSHHLAHSDIYVNAVSSSQDSYTALHEIGHALGLGHSDSTHANASIMVDQTPENLPTGLLYEDIAALQQIYGVNTAYNNGATTYTIDAGSYRREALWDGGGSDTLDSSDYGQNVTVDLQEGVEHVSTIGKATLWMAAGSAIEHAETGSGNDILLGNSLNNVLSAGKGNDNVSGNGGNDSIVGFDGNDALSGGEGNDSLDGGSGIDSLLGGEGDDTLLGGKSADMLYGNEGNDLLDGGDSNDTLAGGSGNDTLKGGGGDDRFVISVKAGAQDIITDFKGRYANEVIDLTAFGAITSFDALMARLSEVSRVADGITIIDSVIDLGNGQTLTLQNITASALTANDFAGGASLSSYQVIEGTSGMDTLTGSAQADSILGGYGNDVLTGGAGSDRLLGENGNDTLSGGSGNDTLTGGSGDDIYVIAVSAGDADIITDFKISSLYEAIDLSAFANIINFEYLIAGASEVVRVVGMQSITDTVLDLGNGQSLMLQNVVLNKLTASDFLGGAGVSTVINGTSASDILTGLAEGESIKGGSGNDTISGNDGNDVLTGDNGNDILSGGNGNDQLFGLSDDDSLSGGAGNDTLDGGKGNDTLEGGAGTNLLTGGDAFDTFVIKVNAGATDTITDFKTQYTEEKIDLSAFNLGDFNDLKAIMTQQGGNTVIALANNQTVILQNVVLSAIKSFHIIGVDPVLDVTGINGTSANDILTGTAGPDSVVGGSGLDTVTGGDGNDTITGDNGDDILNGDAGNDSLNGGANNDSIYGGDGNDVLIGDKGNDRLLGGDGNDTITGDDGDDIVDGGSGNDSISTGSGNEFILGGAGNDTIDGGKGNDTIYAGDGNDSIIGFDGNDEIYTGSGNNTISVGLGEDRVVIGAYANKTDVITDFKAASNQEKIDLSAFTTITSFTALMALATDTAGGVVFDLGNNQTLTLQQVVKSELSAADFIGGASKPYVNPISKVLFGTSGNDSLLGGDGNDRFVFDGAVLNSGDTISGGIGSDVIEITGSGSIVIGATLLANKTGIDSIELASNTAYSISIPNALVTASDASSLTVDASAVKTASVVIDASGVTTLTNTVSLTGGLIGDTLTGGKGNDTILGLSGNDSIIGGIGNDSIEGNSGNDTADGGTGYDTVRGYEGDDSLIGGSDNDRLDGGIDNDTLDGGSGNDTLRGGTGNDSLKSGSGDDYVHAGDGNDTISGYDGNDFLQGEWGDDSVKGEEGNDILNGGHGSDTLIGGNGNDIFVVQQYADTVSSSDRITDFVKGSDKIDLSLFTSITHFSDLSGKISVSGSTTTLNLSATQNVVLQNFTGTLAASDFKGLDQTIYDVHAYGAFGDNIHDDRIAIQAAVDAAAANGGGVVYLSAGTYRVSGTGDAAEGAIVLKNNVTLKGDGMGLTSIKIVDNYSDKVTGIVRTQGGVENKNITIMDLTLDGNRQTATNVNGATGEIDGFYCGVTPGSTQKDEDITLLRVEVQNSSGYGFDPHEQTYRLSIIDSKAHDNHKDGFVADYMVDSLYEGNVSYNNDRHGFNVVTSSHDVVFKNNIAYDNGGNGLTIQRGFEDIAWPSNITVIGGSYYNNDLAGILLNMSSHVTVTGADIYGNARQGINIEGAEWSSIDGNQIHGNSQAKVNTYDEIWLHDDNDAVATGGATDLIYGAMNNSIINNNIYAGAIASRYSVFEMSGNSDYNTILNNETNGSLTGKISISGENSVMPVAENVIKGTAGNDLLLGNTASEMLMGLDGNDTLQGGDNLDTLQGGAGADSLQGGNGNDVLYGDEDADTLSGDAGNDTLFGGEGNDTASGGTNDDFIAGGIGNDVLSGDSGGDMILGEQGNDSISGGEGDDLLYGGDGQDTVTGNEGNDLLNGDAGNDLLNGGDGNDVLQGNSGNDTMVGGLGNDAYYVDSILDEVSEDAASGSDIVVAEISYNLGANVENLTLSGNNAINATGNSLDNVITGNGGSNIIDGGAGHDAMTGGSGDDSYVVDSVLDTVIELSGGGVDTINSSVSYTLSSNVENLTLTGELSINATGNSLSNVISGNSGNNFLTGDNGNDTLIGGEGEDTLSGGVGDDAMEGGLGNDLYYIDSNSDVITESADAGVDTVITDIIYTLSNNVENLILATGVMAGSGNSLNNLITGNSSDNSLYGDAGNDTLIGGAGDDTLSGGLGNNLLEGGSGDDNYMVSSSDDIITELVSSGRDTVITAVSYTIGNNVENLTLDGTGDINGTGNSLGNVIIGNSGNNTIDGGAGNDTMDGGLGNDSYVVSNTSDMIIEAADSGIDTIVSDISYTLDALDSHVENLTLNGSTLIDGTGNSLDNLITGNSASNSLTGGAGDDTLSGGGGNDTLDGGLGNDFMSGGSGNDIYQVDSSLDAISETSSGGSDTVIATVNYSLSANIETLMLEGAAVSGTGNSQNNLITGTAAANTIDGGVGNDTMEGGTGDDTYVVDSVSDVVTENIGAGTDTVLSSISTTIGANVENLTLNGTLNINGTGNSLNNVITGNSGNNSLDGGAGANTLQGGAGNDSYHVSSLSDDVIENADAGTDAVITTITYTLGDNVENLILDGEDALNGTGNSLDNLLLGNNGDNHLYGGLGNDTLNGGEGTNAMEGGAGNDTYYVSSATDIITEAANAGVDTIVTDLEYLLGTNLENVTLISSTSVNIMGNVLDNVLSGNSGSNSLEGGAGNDTLLGASGDDTLSGSSGNDSMAGGGGNDVYYVDSLLDIITETDGAGTDSVITDLSYTLSANVEDLTLGGSSAVNGTGNALDNVLTGNNASNSLSGGLGSDTLDGGTGNDTLDGGEADDTIIITAADFDSLDSIIGGAGIDTLLIKGIDITAADFAHVTRIEKLLFDTDAAHALTLTDSVVISSDTGSMTIDFTAAVTENTGIYLDGGTIISTTLSVEGGAQHDTIKGGGGADILYGNAGNDSVLGGAGNDVLIGGSGNDSMTGGSGSDRFVIGKSAGDTDVSTDFIAGSAAGYETLDLSAFSQFTSYTDILMAAVTDSSGNTVINLGDGQSLTLNAISKYALRPENFETIPSVSIWAGTNSAESQPGAAANEVYFAQGGNDTINGGVGNDYIDGGTGTDYLTGGSGIDTLIGGAGSDNHIFTSNSDSGIGSGNRDIIVDFESTNETGKKDKIDLSQFSGTFTLRGGHGEADFTGTSMQVAFQQEGSNTIVYVDSNGDLTTDFEIQLIGTFNLITGNFNL